KKFLVCHARLRTQMSLRMISLELAQHACANRELCTRPRAHKPCREIPSLVDRLSYLTSAVAESRKAWRSVRSVKSVIQHRHRRAALGLLVRRRRRKRRARTEPLERDEISLTSPISLTCSSFPSLKSLDYSPPTSRAAAAY